MGNARVFDTNELLRERAGARRAYLEFLREPAMSAGLYVLPAGGKDLQSPHTEDEVYVVLRGRAQIRLGETDCPVTAGAVVYVPAGIEHHFHDIEEDLEVLVLFAPAEGTGALT